MAVLSATEGDSHWLLNKLGHVCNANITGDMWQYFGAFHDGLQGSKFDLQKAILVAHPTKFR
jgi:hypothetical protein